MAPTLCFHSKMRAPHLISCDWQGRRRKSHPLRPSLRLPTTVHVLPTALPLIYFGHTRFALLAAPRLCGEEGGAGSVLVAANRQPLTVKLYC